MSSIEAIFFDARISASTRFGVTKAARGSRSSRSNPMAEVWSSRAPLVAINTGSTTSGGRPVRLKKSVTTRTRSREYNIPVLTASGGNSSKTASICRLTIRGAQGSMARTSRGFCAVMQVTALVPCTPRAANVFKSAWIPAPPPLSEPAMDKAVGIFPGCLTRKTGDPGNSFPHRGVVLEPFQIAVARPDEKVIGKPLDCLGLVNGFCFDPAVAFDMAIGESDYSGILMLGGRHVVIEADLLGHNEPGVANEPGRHIQEREDLRGRGPGNVALFYECLVIRMVVVQGRPFPVDVGIQRVTAHFGKFHSVQNDRASVRRTFVDGGRLQVVGEQRVSRIEQQIEICERRWIPVAIPQDPEFESIGWAGVSVGRELVHVISGIQLQGQGQLALVVHALNLPRLLLRGGQSWQEQTRQNGDDGNHHQQFDQCKAAPGSRLRSLNPLQSFDFVLHQRLNRQQD